MKLKGSKHRYWGGGRSDFRKTVTLVRENMVKLKEINKRLSNIEKTGNCNVKVNGNKPRC